MMSKSPNSENTQSSQKSKLGGNFSNIFTRPIAIWKQNFLANLIKEKKSSPTWGFWFFWNSVFTILIVIFLALTGYVFINKTIEKDFPKLPDFTIDIVDGKLSTNLEEPINFEDDNIKFILDTKEIKYNESSLANFETGVFINSEKIVIKEDKYKKQEIPFTEFEEDFHLTKDDTKTWLIENKKSIITTLSIMGSIFIWLFINIFRLLTALWWGLLLMIIGKISDIKNLNFGTSYLAILNLYFIPL
ncbi:MAG: DUF1189 domain-containing protein, partial [Candidatus Peregrinibacteria bacterium]|nr:DUF1189 domain-containing protein [Candidatus Peregrinibacteria bacterium]